MQLDKLIDMSQKYGSNKNYVLAGGGNTSFKEKGIIAVKASGTSLGTIDETGFVLMDVNKLKNMLNNTYPQDDTEREAAVILDMNRACINKQENKRPSVECILHALFKQAYVLHVHPALVNGMTCGVQGKEYCNELFGDRVVWIPLTKPGYILSKYCEETFKDYELKHKQEVDIVFLANHGLFVAGETTEEIDTKITNIMETLASCIKKEPDFNYTEITIPQEIKEISPFVTASVNKDLLFYSKDKKTMGLIKQPFTPDHIVYCKKEILYNEDLKIIKKEIEDYQKENGYQPRVIVVKDEGLFTLGESLKVAEIAKELFWDAISIAVYSESFGGPLGLSEEFSEFIKNWEIESYRAKKSLKD